MKRPRRVTSRRALVPRSKKVCCVLKSVHVEAHMAPTTETMANLYNSLSSSLIPLAPLLHFFISNA